MAEKTNDWKTERVLPTAVSISSKQIYFVFMALYCLVCPKLQSREALMFFLVLFGLLSYFLLVPFRKAIFEYVKNSNVIYKAKKELSKIAGPAISIVFSVITFSIFAVSFGFKMYETLRTLN